MVNLVAQHVVEGRCQRSTDGAEDLRRLRVVDEAHQDSYQIAMLFGLLLVLGYEASGLVLESFELCVKIVDGVLIFLYR